MRKIILPLVLSVVGVLSGARAYADSAPFPNAPCTERESWPKTSGYEYVESRMGQLQGDSESTGLLLLKTYTESKNTRDPNLKSFQDYILYRGLYKLKQIRVANEGFNKILDGKGSIGVHFAALACLVEIRNKYPILGLSSQ